MKYVFRQTDWWIYVGGPKISLPQAQMATLSANFFLSWYICHKHPCEIESLYQVVCFIQLSEAGVLSVSLKMDKIEYRAVKNSL